VRVVSEKQIALLLSSVAMVLMFMSGLSIVMTASLRAELTEKFDSQQKLIDKLTDNQLAMLPFLDPDHRKNVTTDDEVGQVTNDPEQVVLSAPAALDEQPQATDLKPVAKPESESPDQHSGRVDPESSTAPSKGNSHASAGMKVPDDMILALASPVSLPPTSTPKMAVIEHLSKPEQIAPRTKPAAVFERVDGILIRKIVSNWHRPPSARDGMTVGVVIKMERDGRLKSAKITRSSGDKYFDQSAIDAIMAVQKVAEIKHVSDDTYRSFYKERNVDFSPEALSG
jgi:TonB family protein